MEWFKILDSSNTCLVVFASVNIVLRAEKILKKHKVPFRLMPTPKKIASHCDISIIFDKTILSDIRNILESASIRAKGYYIKEGGGYIEV